MRNRWRKWGIHFDLPGKKQRVEELERKIEEPGFWDHAEESQKVMKELKSLQEFVKEAEAMSASYDDIVMLMEMADEE